MNSNDISPDPSPPTYLEIIVEAKCNPTETKNTIQKIFQPRRFKFAELFKYIKFEELPISQVLNLSRDDSYEYFNNYFKFKSSKLFLISSI